MGNSLEGQPWDEPDHQRPRKLGQYELLGTLGTGGMATVYLARKAGEAGFQRLFAVKVLHPHLMKEAGFRAMFLDEARIAARLHHPNIVPIIDLSAEHDGYYVALEYIEGCSLSALLKKHKDDRPAKLLVTIMLDALAGLDAAHNLTDDSGKAMNVVHRDVSPQNVLVGSDGSARITDFGIARAESRISGTRPGQLKGKIAYMSPEQIRGKELDRRSDLFSAGAMLWSMLTGRKLFEGENDAATMSNILELEVPPPSAIGLKPPTAFDKVCLRALERDPAKRYASAQEMEEELRQAAIDAGLLGSRRDVAAWVTESFGRQINARRTAIRNAASRPMAMDAVSSTSLTRPSAEFPSITPTASAVVDDHEIEISGHAAASTAAPSAVTQSSKRRLGLLLGVPAVCAAGVAIWLAMRPAGHAAPSAAPAPESTEVATRDPAKTDPSAVSATAPTPAPAPAAATAPVVPAPTPAPAAEQVAAAPPVAETPEPAHVMKTVKKGKAAKTTVVKAAPAPKTVTPPPTKVAVAQPQPQPLPAPVPAPAPAPQPVAIAPAPAPKPAPVVTAPAPRPAVAAKPAEIGSPRLPATYSARSMNELQKVLGVIEGEAIAKGNAPESIRGVTSGIAEEAFSSFAPGQLIEVHPRAIYYAIAKAARDGKSAGAIRSSLKNAFQNGQL